MLPTSTQSASSRPTSASTPLLRPTAPPRAALMPLQPYKHESVAMALLEAVVRPGFSLAPPPATGDRVAWMASLASSLLQRFQPGTLAAVLRTWTRLLQWQVATEVAMGSFSDLTLRDFLLAQGRRGRTVPAAVFNHLRWLHEHLQVPMPLTSPLLAEFTSCPHNTWPTQAEALGPQAWKQFLHLAGTRPTLRSHWQLASSFALQCPDSATSTVLELRWTLTCPQNARVSGRSPSTRMASLLQWDYLFWRNLDILF